MAKPKVAFYWAASCGGCEEAVVDLGADLLDVVEAVEIVFWPAAFDFKRSDVEAMADGEIAVSFINGAVRTGEQKEMVKLLRQKSGLVVAFGTCAHLGGIPGLANFWDRKSILNRAYKEAPSVVNPEGVLPETRTVAPEGKLALPEFFNTVLTLGQVVLVDYYLPGCAPPADLILQALKAILEGNLPAKGSVLAPDKQLCDTCPRRDSKPEKILVKEFKRVHELKTDTEKCFLVDGIICMGSATRSGCGERCIKANMPCLGCFGPTAPVLDQGAKLLSALASIMDAKDEDEARRIADTIADPAGMFYMYSMPASLLHRCREEGIYDKKQDYN